MEIIFRGFSTAFDPADIPLGWGVSPTRAAGESEADPRPSWPGWCESLRPLGIRICRDLCAPGHQVVVTMRRCLIMKGRLVHAFLAANERAACRSPRRPYHQWI